MKYVSIDLETTGLDNKGPEKILQISMIVEDTNNLKPLDQLPHFTAFIKQSEITGEPYALAMNYWILDIISGRKENNTNYPIISLKELYAQASEFLNEHFPKGSGKIPFAGKNVAMFDYNFLPSGLQKRVSYRIIDPTSMFIDWKKDEKPPGLGEIKKRLGLEEVVTHDAFDDALDVIKILRTQYEG